MKIFRKQVRAFWWIYIAVLFVFVVIKFDGSVSGLADRIAMYSQPGYLNYNLTLFRTIESQLRYASAEYALTNLLGNVIPFLPFGFLLPLAYPKTYRLLRVFLVGIGSVLFIELFQLVTKLGSFDVDDILLNIIGILAGYGLLNLLRCHFAEL